MNDNDKKKKMAEVKKRIFYLRIAVIILICIFILGIGYAWFKNNRSSEKNNVLVAGSLSLSIDNESDAIKLIDALPESETSGLKDSSYTFTLTNTGSATMAYNIFLSDTEITDSRVRLSDSSIMTNLVKDGNTATSKLLSTYTNKKTTVGADRYLDSGLLKKGESHNYILHLWINIDAGNEVADKEFSAHIAVDGTQFVPKDKVIGLNYSVNSDGKTATIYGSNSGWLASNFAITGLPGYYPQDFNLPETIDGYYITGMASYDYAYWIEPFRSNVTNLFVPYRYKQVSSMPSNSMTSITFENTAEHPSQLETILDENFMRSVNLDKIAIPASVKSIGKTALALSTKLKTITIENTTAHPSQLTTIGDKAFGSDTALEEITLPESVTSIGASAFGGCTNLKKVYIQTKDINNPQTITFGANWLPTWASYEFVQK